MLALTVGHGCHWLPLVATVRRAGPSVDISTRRGFLNTMNTLNSMLRSIPLATMVVVALIALFGALTYAALYPPFVGAQTKSSHATLSALTVNDGTSDVALNPGFTSAGTSYRTAVKYRGERLTVTATTNVTNATIAFLDRSNAILADLDDGTGGHQVDVPVGDLMFKIKVTAQDNTELVYEVTVERNDARLFGWTPTRDLNGLTAAGNDNPQGIWSNGTTMWVADDDDDKLYAYALATGARDMARDIASLAAAGNDSPRGIWSDETTVWVVDDLDNKLYAYALATGARDSVKDITLDPANGAPWGIWSDGTIIWVTNDDDLRLYAYTLDGGTRQTDIEFLLSGDTRDPRGIWSDGSTLWVSSLTFDANKPLVAYTLDFSSNNGGTTHTVGNLHGLPDWGKSFYTPGTLQLMGAGIWSDGDTAIWMASTGPAGKIYSFNTLPSQAGGVSLSALTVNDGTSNVGLLPGFNLKDVVYWTSVANDVNVVTVSATASNSAATLEYVNEDADSASGHQVDVAEGTTLIGILVTAPDGAALIHQVYVERDSSRFGGWTPTKDIHGLVADGITQPTGIWSDNTTMWVVDYRDFKLYAYTLATGARNEDREFDLDPANDAPHGLWSDGTTIWVGSRSTVNLKLFAYTLEDDTATTSTDEKGQRDPTKDILLDASNNAPSGIWSNGTDTVWVAEQIEDKLYAYTLDTGSDGEAGPNHGMRKTGSDITLQGPAEHWGIWSDGTTMWEGNNNAKSIRAYKLATSEREESKDIPFAPYQSNTWGIWSDGSTMWTVHSVSQRLPYVYSRIFSHTLPASGGATTLSNLTVTPSPAVSSFTATLRPTFSSTTNSYGVAVPNAAEFVTISPTLSDNAATAAYQDEDDATLADANQTEPGHQVSVPVGTFVINIKITKMGEPSITYTVHVERDSAERFGWTPTKDLNTFYQDNPEAAGQTIRGVWGDGMTLYVTPHNTAKVFAFDPTDGTRIATKDIVTTSDFFINSLGRHAPIIFAGIWSDGTTMWVVDYYRVHDADGGDLEDQGTPPRRYGKLFAYGLMDGERDKTKEFVLDPIHDASVRGVWSNGTTLWVSDYKLGKLIAYHLKDNLGTRDVDKDITLHSDNDVAQGIWSDGTTIWVVQWNSTKFFAYTLATGVRDTDKEFDRVPGNHFPRDIWSDGTTLYVPDHFGQKLFSYTIANALPTFTEGASTSRTFNETLGDEAVATAGNIGTPVAATDADTGDTLTYSLEGTDMARFGIVRTSGQLQTKVGEKYSHEEQSSYSVTVKVEDGNSGSDTITVTLNVMDQNEAPLAPSAPSVSATTGSTTSLDVSWTAPTNTGRPAITNYDLQYQKTTETGWTDGPQNETGLSATIGDLDTGTEYRVQVRATNAEGGDNWSASGNGSTNTPTNALPTFTEGGSTSRAFNETLGDEAVATAGNIGTPVAATDADTGDTLTYSLEGTDMARFGIVRTSGQLQTKVGEKYSHEEQSSYSVTVKVEDGNSGSDTITVTLNVMDQNEAPLAPSAPSVSATTGSTTSLDVSWTAPTNTGRPAITNYDLQYQKTTETGWTDGPQNETGLSATIGDLDTGTEYRVQVRATNAEGGDNWSASGNGSTNTPTNALPTFTEGASTSRAFNETLGDEAVATAGNIGTPVAATDADNDTLTYRLEGTAAARFGIVRTSGQLQTKVGEKYSHEENSSYSVRVKVEDGNSGSDTIAVTLNVMDQDEAPLAPNAPSVSATPGSNNSLDVSWTAPTNTGRPAITNYDLQYQKTTETEWTDGPQNVTNTSTSIPNLTAGTSYRVQVRARNAEGAVAWSASGTGRTDTPTAPGVSVLPTVLMVTEEDTAGASYTVVLDSQPTADVTVTVAGHSGTEVTPTPTSLTFTTSNWESAQMVTVTAGADADTENESVTLTHSAASMDSEYQGITIDSVAVTVNDIAVGICGRTKEVRDALVDLIPGVSGCAAVTAADLAAITGTLDLSGQSIADLAAGDFAGLTSLMELYLDNNKLPELPDDVFAGLTSLEVLYLNNNDLTELPGGVFEPLTSLEVLYLNNNDLTTLPGGVFDQLTMLKVLTLYYNALTMLPDGVFELLTRLNFLYMEDNPGVPFAPTADARPDAGRVAVDGGTVRLDGSGSGGPWGTNISYSWALTTPASGVTFDDATSVTPEVTIPELAADTELTFTLTVTGRGHIGSGTATATATATAKVTATLNITNNPPVFAGGTVQARILAETLGDAAVTTASDIGAPVSATDTDTGDTLTYVLLGADRDKFTFDTSSGQIKTKSGESYDYEAQSSYSVTVAVIDGTVTVSAAVTINVTDQNEPPLAMMAPMVTVTQESATSLEVSWTEPTNTGRPNIDSYDLQYRVGNTGGFINGPQNRTGTSAPIGKLTANTSYEVQVRATNAEGDGAWSVAGSGTTGTTTTTDTPGVSVSPTALTVTEGDTTGDSYTVVLDSQPTADVTVTVGGHAGTEVTPTPTSLIFTTSNWSTAQTVTVTAADTVTMNDTVTLTHSAESTDSNYSSGITTASVAVTVTDDDDTAAGICGRTAEVRDALLRLIENNEGAAVACADVTAAQLAAITGPLDLAVENITALAAGDFAGLTALKTLNLDHNKLTALPDDVFAGLTALKVLYLNDNKLTALPDDVFDGLTALEFLYLGNNELTMLPEDVFAGLTSLKLLYLDNNGLTALPDNVFEPLTALKVLRLQGNPVASFAPEADARPDNGTVPVGGGTVRLDGSGSGGAWGTNVAYRWALTSPGSGVTVMFDNDRSATPVVTIPELTAGTALTFTLTVTGRGHIGSATGIGTDTAKVTATDSVTASGDATLGGLTVNDGTSDLTLAPAFALGTFVYTASVGNAVATVTLTATVNHAGASVSAVTLDGNAIADSDFTDGITVSSLIEGGNGIVVTVTAENGATQTYTVTVSRAATTATAAGVSVSETALTVTEGDTTGASYTVVLDTQPTAGVTVTVAGHSGTDVTPNPTSLIFTTSNWNTAQTITVTAADTVTMNDTVTLTHSAASTDSNYSSITIADVTVTVNDDDTAAGICPRTPEVRDALLALIPGVSGCADVTDAQLAAITGPLKLSSQSIDELAAGDFAGLTALETLNLFNNELTGLPDDVFAGLTALETLNLGHNELTALPDNVFAGLTALKVLYLNDNRLTALPDGVFAELTSLEFLYLGKNKQLTELPVGVFAGLTSLKLLYLDNNGLTSLPDGVFEGLISLQVLRLVDNPGASFAPTADARPDDGTVPVAGGTVTLDGSGSGSGGPWGTNVTYRWALTTPASGVTVMFDNATSAMPEATIQALAADTELTFTLTVTGRGHIGSGTDTGTDTAKVTATEPMARAARSNSVPQPERRQSAGRHRWGRR